MKDLGLVNIHHLSDEVGQRLETRQAVRAVVFDDEQKVALIHVTQRGYYKIPGGGIEPGENHVTALARECQEEIGCEVEVFGEVGEIREYRDMFQTSYCYLARLKGTKGSPTFTELEASEGHQSLWVPLEEAIHLVEEAKPQDNNGVFIHVRDAILLKEAAKLIRADKNV